MLLILSFIFISTQSLALDSPKDDQPVKMSKYKICHAPNSKYYIKTQNFTPYKTLQDCIAAGGRLPKNRKPN